MKVEVKEKVVIYSAGGVILGKLWMGGEGAYGATPYRGFIDKEELKEEVEKGVKDGSIDSGFGFQKVLGALMTITKETSLNIEGKWYINKSYEEKFFGELDDKQKAFLDNYYDNI